MSGVSLNNIQVIGFETEKNHFFEEKKDQFKFNAFRILGYIPIISTIAKIFETFMIDTTKKYKDELNLIKKKETELQNELLSLQLNVATYKSQYMSNVFKGTANQIEHDKKIKEFESKSKTIIAECNILSDKSKQLSQKCKECAENTFFSTFRNVVECFSLGFVFLPFDITETIIKG